MSKSRQEITIFAVFDPWEYPEVEQAWERLRGEVIALVAKTQKDPGYAALSTYLDPEFNVE